MRKAFAVSLLFLAACSQQEGQQRVVERVEPTPAPVTQVAAPVVASETSAEFKAARLRNPLPEGIEFPFAYHRLNDNMAKAGTPDPERRVHVEIRQVAAQEAEAAFTDLLLQKGFSLSDTQVAKGVRELKFSRDDGVKLTVKVKPRHSKPKAPDATGTLHLVWQSP